MGGCAGVVCHADGQGSGREPLCRLQQSRIAVPAAGPGRSHATGGWAKRLGDLQCEPHLVWKDLVPQAQVVAAASLPVATAVHVPAAPRCTPPEMVSWVPHSQKFLGGYAGKVKGDEFAIVKELCLENP